MNSSVATWLLGEDKGLGKVTRHSLAISDTQRQRPGLSGTESGSLCLALLLVSGLIALSELECPRQDSNLRTRLRRPLLYPLSYGGVSSRLRGDG